MLVLTHDGPGYRSKLTDRETALARGRELAADPQFVGVKTMESQRSRSDFRRYFVVCLPACEDKRRELLQQFQWEREQRAQEEGPRYLWVADASQPGAYHLFSLSDEVYVVSAEHGVCSCRDAGVCRDNGLLCKHVIALQKGLGQFFTAQQWERLQVFVQKLGEPSPERHPVALPIAA